MGDFTTTSTTLTTTTTVTATTITGSAGQGSKKEIKGKLVFKVATKKECDDMAAAAGKTAIIKMLADESKIPKTNIAVTVACTAARRLSDGRRLSKYNADVGYTITVPANSAVANTLTGFDTTAWKNKLEKTLSDAGITVTITDLVKTDPTTTTIHDVSSAMTWATAAGLLLAAHFLF